MLKNQIIAIHCGVQDDIIKKNIGRLITQDLIDKLKMWT